MAIRYRRPVVEGHAPKSVRDLERDEESRHLLRSLLRECTYLPDSFARTWTSRHVLQRFRKYGFKAWQHRDDPAYEERIREKLREGRQALGMLRRANEGERKPLLRVLLMAYGRTGKRRHELMMPLVPMAMQRDVKEGLKVAEAMKSSGEDGAVEVRSTSPRPSAVEINKGQWIAYERDFTPQLRALLESQVRTPPPHLTRPNLRRLRPKVEELNSWLRPMPRSRVKNQTKQWYADVLQKVHPPLPMQEWQRLRDLAAGEPIERVPARRKAIAPSRQSALEMVVMYGKPEAKKAFGNREAHQITPRYMRRLWTQVFSQCPVMQWDAEKMRWSVTWGEQALH